MDIHQLKKLASGFTAGLAALVLLAACSAQNEAVKPDERLLKESAIRTSSWKPDTPPPPAPASPPEFISMTEEIVPLKTKIVNIVVRNSSLGDVLHVVAETSGLNLLIDREVALDQPVTLSLRNVSAEDALKTIFSTVDCFYTIDNNLLKVESLGTKVFELGHPALVNNYAMDVGGDILGGAVTGGNSNNIKGTISSGSKADAKAYDFWESLEKSLDNIMGKKTLAAAGDAKAAPVTPGTISQRTREGNSGVTTLEMGSTATGTSRSSEGQQQSITINRLTGTIMVTATRKNMDKVERYIENVRKVLGRQVVIEARIIEVQLSKGFNFGIDWSFIDGVKAIGGSLSSGFSNKRLSPGDDAAFSAATNTNQFQLGISKGNFQAILTALKTQGDVKTLSNPKINVMNGHASILTVGDNASYISKITTKTETINGASTTSVIPEIGNALTGLMIGIVPFIAESGDISLNITPITSKVILTETILKDGSIIKIPTAALREMTTTVKIRDGQMVIIGGLISKAEVTNDEKIPLLGDIPYLGRLFTRTSDAETRSELVLLLRPQIVNND